MPKKQKNLEEIVDEAMVDAFREAYPDLASTLEIVSNDPNKKRADAKVGEMVTRAAEKSVTVAGAINAYWQHLRKGK